MLKAGASDGRSVPLSRSALGLLGLLGVAIAGCSGASSEDGAELSGGEPGSATAVTDSPTTTGNAPQATAPEGAATQPSATQPAATQPAMMDPSEAPEAMPPLPTEDVPAATTDDGSTPAVDMPDDAANAPDPVAITPPVLDTASLLPVARQSGFTTDANVIYGPLPQQRMDIIYPPNAGPNGTEKLPAVLMFHGGGWIQGDKATVSSFYSRFLNHGFIVASVEYRVANMGIAPAAVEDALLAAKWFWDHMDYYNADKSKFIVTGASSGGHLALMVGMATAESNLGPTNPTDFQIAAIINGYGPADVNDMLARRVGFAVEWLPDNTPDHDALATRVSPITYARLDMPPLLTVQGTDDTTVPVAEGLALDAALQALGADAAHHLVQGAGHGFTTPASAWPDAEATIFDFLVARGIGK